MMVAGPYTGVLYPLMSVAPVFIRSLALVRRSVTVLATDLTPLESLIFTNRNRAESTIPDLN